MPALRAGTHQNMDHEGEMKEAEEVIAIMESLSTVINTDDEFHAIQQLAQNLRSLVHMCQLNQKEVQACLQGITSPAAVVSLSFRGRYLLWLQRHYNSLERLLMKYCRGMQVHLLAVVV